MIPADTLLRMVSQCKSDLLIIAPYIKAKALDRLLKEMPDNLPSLRCVTRWLPVDIASGVCDLEIFDLLHGMPNAQLFVHPYLHAKYYRADDICLVGSANVTYRGLGWAAPSNLELTVEMSVNDGGLAEWEQRLLSDVTPATIEIRDRIAAEASKLKSALLSDFVSPEVTIPTTSHLSPGFWLPTCTVPDRLWDVYKGQAEAIMVTSSYNAARADLVALSPPENLSHENFMQYMAGMLLKMPLVEEIDQLASAGLSDARAHDLLAEKLPPEHPMSADIAAAWEILKEWLTLFASHEYLTETSEQILFKGRHLPKKK